MRYTTDSFSDILIFSFLLPWIPFALLVHMTIRKTLTGNPVRPYCVFHQLIYSETRWSAPELIKSTISLKKLISRNSYALKAYKSLIYIISHNLKNATIIFWIIITLRYTVKDTTVYFYVWTVDIPCIWMRSLDEGICWCMEAASGKLFSAKVESIILQWLRIHIHSYAGWQHDYYNNYYTQKIIRRWLFDNLKY